LYVRFLPYGKQGVYELKTYDTSLVLFKHPMDYNEIKKPIVYMDKSLPDSIIPYFASAPVGYEFGPTSYEILQELFLTQPLEENDGDYQEDSRFVKAQKSNKANKEIAAYLKSQDLAPYQLEMMALPNSERFKAEAESSSNKVLAKTSPFDMDNIVAWHLPIPFVSTWRPSGTLKYYDEQLEKDMPLVSIRVTAGYSYYWRSSKTDGNGYFSSPEQWKFSVDYEANFDSDQFLLQDGHSWYGEDLEIEKNNKKSAWNETFTGNHARWCIVWTAARNYWYGDIYGLKRPRQNWLLSHSLEINVYYKNNKDYENSFTCWADGVFGTDGCKNSVGFYNVTPLWENIMIQTYNSDSSRSVPHINIYGTTIHEIAHSSHYYNMNTKDWYLPQSIEYSNLQTILKESYARGIERFLAIKHYGTWAGSYNIIKGYTGIFEDLENTNTSNGYCDRVSGITVPMAEKILFESDSWNNFKDNLIKEYPNGTPNGEGGKVTYFAADMDALFKYWETGIGANCPEPITDTRDGKVYRTIIIDEQTWMAENLNYDATGSKCYNDNTAKCATYGRLYDWSTAMTLPSSCNSALCSDQVNAKHQGICPTDWHIPSTADWDKLMRYIDGNKTTYSPYDSPTAGKYLKATSGWAYYYNENIGSSDDGNGEDKYGFSALPGGYGHSTGSFAHIGSNGDWWSTSEYDDDNAYRLDMYGGDKAGWEDINGNRKHNKSDLFSIRCVKD